MYREYVTQFLRDSALYFGLETSEADPEVPEEAHEIDLVSSRADVAGLSLLIGGGNAAHERAAAACGGTL